MMKLLPAVLVLATLVLPVTAQDKDRSLVTVSGQAEIMVVPDEVQFDLVASTLDKELKTALARNDETVKKVLELARTYNVPPELVKTDYIALEERHSDETATRKPSVFLGYSVTKNIAIVLRDVTKAERMLAELFTSGVTTIRRVEFRTTQLRRHKDQARAMAIKAAQEKANAFARELGQSIGKAYSITEDAPSRFSPSNFSSNSIGDSGDSSADSAGTLALGQISITARVTVSFELK